MVARFLAILALPVACATLAGCSLILDPETCGGDGDCESGRSCQSGICVGPGNVQPEPEPDEGMLPDTGPEPDEGMQPEPEPDAMVEPDADVPDMMIEPDMPPMKAPPSCEITVPATPDVGPLSVDTIEIQGIVTDGDTPLDQLTVTVADAAVSLGDNGGFTVEVPVAEGPNTIRLQASDPDMQSCDAQVRVRVDRTAPTVAILDPNNNIRVNPSRNPYRVSGSLDDASNIAAVRATLAGEPVADVNVLPGEFSFQVDLVEGANQVTVLAEDEAGNVSVAMERTITLDSVPPEVTIETPADGTRTAEAAVTVTGQVTTDGVGENRSRLRVEVNGAEVRLDDAQADGDGRFELSVPLEVGANRIEVFGDDLAENEGSAVVTVTREDPAPCVAIETPADASFVADPEATLTGTVCPAVDRVELRVGDGAPVAGEVADGRFTGSVPLSVGRNQITVRAITPADASAEATRVIHYDDTPPTARINQPVQGACINDAVIRVCGIAEDFESGIAGVRVQEVSSRQEVQAELNDADFCADIEIDDTDEAQVIVTPTNGAGATGRFPGLGSTYTFRVDRTEPEVVIQNGADRPWLGIDAFEEVTLRGTTEGGICQPVSAIWGRLCDGEVPVDPDCDPEENRLGLQEGRFTIRAQIPDGERAIRVTVTDEAGNARITSYAFRVDSEAPEIVERTADQFTAEGEIELCVTASDPASGVTSLLIDNQAIDLQVAGVNATGCRLVALEEGPNVFDVRVADLVGNAVLDTITITRDTTPPELAITWPAANGPVAQPTNIEGTVGDGIDGSGVERVIVRSGESAFNAEVDFEQGRWRATRVPVDLESPVLTVVATDANGNERSVEHPVTVPAYVDLGADQDGFGLDGASDRTLIFDASGDGRLDVLSLSSAIDGTSALYVQREDGSFFARSLADIGLPAAPVRAADAADVDNDGAFDLVVSSAGATRLYLGDGAGAFVETPAGLPNIAATGLALGDVNADTNIDLILLAGLGSRVQFGDGAGTFNSQDLAGLGLAGIGDFTVPVAVDFTGDALIDLALLSDVDSTLYVNQGDSFVQDQRFPSGPADRATALDAQRDGDLDLFISTQGVGHFATNEADGLFNRALGVQFAADEIGLTAGDLDGDTFTDVITYGASGLRAWRGTAAGFEAADLGLPPLADVVAAQIVDLDGDGDQDIVYLAQAGAGVVRSNVRHLDPTYTYTRLLIRRGAPGPIDALGAVIRHEYAPGMVRLIPALPGGATVVSLLGGDVEVLVEFIGGGARTVPALEPNPDPIVAPAAD